jgi:hypothetical protein
MPKWFLDLPSNSFERPGYGVVYILNGVMNCNVCFAWMHRLKTNTPKTLTLLVNDYLSVRHEEDSIFKAMVPQLRKMGFKFRWECRVKPIGIKPISSGTTLKRWGEASLMYEVQVSVERSAKEIFILGCILRDIYEYPNRTFNFLQLVEKHPEVDRFTLYVLAHYINCANWQQDWLGHTMLDRHMRYFQDFLGDKFIASLKEPSFKKHPSFRTGNDSLPAVTDKIIGKYKSGRSHCGVYSEELFNSFFNREDWERWNETNSGW